MTQGSIPSNVTKAACAFIESSSFDQLPAEAVRIARRCILDGLALYVAGSDEESVKVLVKDARETGGRPDALLLGAGDVKVPAGLAARVLGTAGHAHDWDDTQVSRDPAHVYGLLTHPTIPALSASLVMAQRLGNVSGRDLVNAFVTGVEVESKISEWMLPDHYKRGLHSSGTVGTFGAAAAAAKMLGLRDTKLAYAIGIAASMASGIRCNFGTMTKPLHVGRASENGVTAALLASQGFTADPESLDGRWGFMQVQGGGVMEAKLAEGFGKTWSMVEPGISIKPYPCGIVTHQSMDAMLKLVTAKNVDPTNIETIDFHAGSNILNPIRYPVAQNHLQAKFSMAALLSMIALKRRAGRQEFTDAFIQSPATQDMQRRIKTHLDPAIESKGMEIIRSRIEITLKDGSKLVEWANENYRGGPDNPMSDQELEAKVAACTSGLLSDQRRDELIAAAWQVDELPDAAKLAEVIQP
ncbi:MmgE/PrpD family protein [Dongia deserti]|uniref:MmgE/PrpD family protein n=1 Tax=Dongia deserti TaxID=2268030 RepID=UPI000E64F894|nr:MmgE/PrpD family protein [Dongia deserti]